MSEVSRKPSLLVILFCGFIGGTCALAEVQANGYLPEPSLGQIDGMLAMAVAPVEYSDGHAEAIDPDGFEAHLVLAKDRDSELVFPCGTWFRPNAGWYRMWVEGEWAITPYSSRIAFPDVPFRDRGFLTGLPVVGAGRVLLPGTFQTAPHLTLGVQPGPIQVVAWRPKVGQEANWLDSEVVRIPYPWPDLVSVPLVESVD